MAKKNIAISHKKNEIQLELDKIHQQEERIKNLKQRMKNMPISTMTHLKTGNPARDTNSKKDQISNSFTDEDDILIKDIESDDEVESVEESCKEMVFYGSAIFVPMLTDSFKVF